MKNSKIGLVLAVCISMAWSSPGRAYMEDTWAWVDVGIGAVCLAIGAGYTSSAASEKKEYDTHSTLYGSHAGVLLDSEFKSGKYYGYYIDDLVYSLPSGSDYSNYIYYQNRAYSAAASADAEHASMDSHKEAIGQARGMATAMYVAGGAFLVKGVYELFQPDKRNKPSAKGVTVDMEAKVVPQPEVALVCRF